MEDTVGRHARDLVDAIAAAVARDAGVQACRERALADGLELTVSLEATVGAAGRSEPAVRASVALVSPPSASEPPAQPFEVTAADRRFLRSLRIAADSADGA